MTDPVDDYLAAVAGYRYPEAGDDMPAIGGRELLQRVFGKRDEAGARRLIEALPGVPDPFAAAMLAVMLGAQVEHGVDPGPLGAALAARLPADFAAARRFAEALDAEYPKNASPAALQAARRADPVGGAAWDGQQHATMAAMTAWCRDAASRRAAAAVPGFIDDARALAARDGYAYFIAELLGAADGVELIVLVPGVGKGFVFELEVVRNAAQLFALLEDALNRPGLLDRAPIDPAIAALAHGAPVDGRNHIFAIDWHYEYWFGDHPARFAALAGVHPRIAAMIGVEVHVPEFPLVRGQRVILMKPRFLAERTCNANGFFGSLHAALRSHAHLRRTLSADEVTAWLATLASEAATPAG